MAKKPKIQKYRSLVAYEMIVNGPRSIKIQSKPKVESKRACRGLLRLDD